MNDKSKDQWTRVKERLRAEVGEDNYTSWFASMDFDGGEDEGVRLTVPTRFLKSWIQSHYLEKLIGCWQAEDAQIIRVDINVRSAIIRSMQTKPKAPALPEPHRNGVEQSSTAQPAHSALRPPPRMRRSAARRSIRG